MLVLNRFIVEEDAADRFTQRARAALTSLAARPGYQRGGLSRALDDPRRWCLLTEWDSVGTYRRALGDHAVRVEATPLLAESLDEPSAYEPLVVVGPGGETRVAASDRAQERAW